MATPRPARTAAAGVACLALGAVLAGCGGTTPVSRTAGAGLSDPTTARRAEPATTPATGPATMLTAEPPTHSTATPRPTPGPTAGPTPAPAPQEVIGTPSAPGLRGVEVLPEGEASVQPPARTPRPVPVEEVARAVRATGALVRGWPALVRPVAGSRILASSVSPGGAVLQASLRARVAKRLPAVLRDVRRRLLGQGFSEEAVHAGAAPGAIGFTRSRPQGDDAVTVSISDSGPGGTTYAVLAVLHPGRG